MPEHPILGYQTSGRSRMKHYLLIESEPEFGSDGRFLALARDLARGAAKVDLLLVQNGVMSARAGAKVLALPKAIEVGVTVWADEFALRERALAPGDLVRGVRPAPLSKVIECLAAGAVALWH